MDGRDLVLVKELDGRSGMAQLQASDVGVPTWLSSVSGQLVCLIVDAF